MSKVKSKKPKKWYEQNITTLMTNMGILVNRLHSLESTIGMYIEMKKDGEKLKKYIENKIEIENKKNKKQDSQTVQKQAGISKG